jgi:hypothetical protein
VRFRVVLPVSVAAIKPSWSGAHGITLFVKILVVAVSGSAALGALFLGVLLAG